METDTDNRRFAPTSVHVRRNPRSQSAESVFNFSEIRSQGRHYFHQFTKPAVDKALECYARVLALEPTYALAHAAICLACTQQTSMGFVAPRAVMSKAQDAAQKAVMYGEDEAYAHWALAMFHNYYGWDWLEAERE
jgi:hypothetical protein